MEQGEGNKYTDNQINWLKQYTEAEIRSIRDAVNKETVINTGKFENNNEWKATIKDQIARSPSRDELSQFAPKDQLTKLAGDVKSIDDKVDKLDTAFNQFQGIIRFLQFAGAAGVIALLISLLRMKQ